MKNEPKFNDELYYLRHLVSGLSKINEELLSLDLEKAKSEGRSFTEIYYPRRAVALANSIVILLPNDAEPNPSAHSDLSSIACLARAILETYLMFFYFCSDPDSDEADKDLRRKVAFLHMRREEAELGLALQEDPDHQAHRREVVDGFSDTMIKDHPAAGNIPNSIRKNVLKGRELTYIQKPQIAQRAGFEEGLFKAYYRVLSSLTHPHHFGAQTDIRSSALGRNGESRRGQLTIVLFLVNFVLRKMIAEIFEIFPSQKFSIDDNFSDVLKKLGGRRFQ